MTKNELEVAAGQPDSSLPPTTLQPAQNVQKFLISSTCHLSGRYEQEALLLTDAQPALRDQAQRSRMDNELTSRTALMLVFRTNPAEQGGFIIPQYDSAAEWVCSVLSLFYGKRFDSLGPIENSGFFYLPNLRALDIEHDRRLPQNGNSVRSDYGFALDLANIGRLLPLLFGHMNPEVFRPLQSAIKFYRQALISADQDIEIAYLHLITSGEILSGMITLDENSLVDADMRRLLERIDTAMVDEGATSRKVRRKMRSIRRRFVFGLGDLIGPDFFKKSEASNRFDRFDEVFLKRRLGRGLNSPDPDASGGEGDGG